MSPAMGHYERLVDPNGSLDGDERHRRARQARGDARLRMELLLHQAERHEAEAVKKRELANEIALNLASEEIGTL